MVRKTKSSTKIIGQPATAVSVTTTPSESPSKTPPQSIEARLIEFLTEGHFLTSAKIQTLQGEAKKTKMPLEDVILSKGLTKEKDLGGMIADLHGWNFVDLKKEAIEEAILKRIPEALAREKRVIAFGQTAEGLKIALGHPEDTALLEDLKKTVGGPVVPFYATPKDIAEALYRYQREVAEEFATLIEAHSKETAFGELKDNAVVRIVDLLLNHGFRTKTSDIHIEPQSEFSVVRFRIDGILHEIVTIPKAVHELAITRIKILSKMRTDEHQAPQDGKIEFVFEGTPVDIRVSVVPTNRGENAVMRLLSESARDLNLEDLGLCDFDLKKMAAAIKKPWGMILVTGPTGSGKTTTLYAVLKILNTREVNIATIEDPVEYTIDGITQIQVNAKANLNFSAGLRSIVRQDPNIIMVGEIRDVETAQIAVNSAMTGHLVLSTLHTNDAPTALPRLLEMDIEPFLIASTANIIIAQRLVRRICPHCIMTYEVHRDELSNRFPALIINRLFGEKKDLLLYRGKGCFFCQTRGFSGRIGVYEVLEVTDGIRALIMKNADADTVQKKAIEEGMTTMFDDAIDKVLNGVTTIEEMLRVVKS